MTAPFYVGPEQIVRDKSEYARRGIARGRSVVVLTFDEGILFVAENPSTSLHKISEIYDRIGFAAVGRYPEFENLRVAGVRYADTRGYSYDRSDVSGRGLANAFAQSLGSIFIESNKPYEVEVVVAEVGATPAGDNMYRLTFDGSLAEERGFAAMGGQADTITTSLRDAHHEGQTLVEAMRVALAALESGHVAGGSGPAPASANGGGSNGGAAGGPAAGITAATLEVGVLDRTRPRRAFRRITGVELAGLVESAGGSPDPGEQADSANPE